MMLATSEGTCTSCWRSFFAFHLEHVSDAESQTMDYCENHLIEQFPKILLGRFVERCEQFSLTPLAELVRGGQVLTHAYFPCSGVITLLIDVHGRLPLEVGAVGSESMLGAELLLGAIKSPWRAVVLGAGTCWRIEAQALRQAMTEMPALQTLLQHNFIVKVHQRQALASASGRTLRPE